MTATTGELNIGLVGVGRWGRQHINAIRRARGVRLVALCASTVASARTASTEHDLPCDSSFDDFLKRDEVAAVVIAAPNGQHFNMTRKALQAGKHALVEKPMSFNRQECDELVALAQANGRVLFPGHEFRLFQLWERFKQLLDEDAVGHPRFLSIDLRRYPYSSGAGGWRHDPAQVGDWLLEEPIHYFDLALWYLLDKAGPPLRLYAASSAGRPERVAWHENFSALITFQDGAYANITRTVASFHFRLQIRLTGSQGTLEAAWSAATDRSPDPVAALTLFRAGDEAPQAIPVSQQTGHAHDLYREIEAFAAAVGGARPVLTGLDGRRAVYLCQAAAESLNSGQPASLDDWR